MFPEDIAPMLNGSFLLGGNMDDKLRNRAENGIIYMGETEFRTLMVRLIISHKFNHDNEIPTKIVLPAVGEVEGVTIEIAPALVEATKTKKQEVKDAIIS